MESQRIESREDNLLLARSKTLDGRDRFVIFNNTFVSQCLGENMDNSYMDNDEITSRTKFPESWLWTDITLPSCPLKTPDWCATRTLMKRGRWAGGI